MDEDDSNDDLKPLDGELAEAVGTSNAGVGAEADNDSDADMLAGYNAAQGSDYLSVDKPRPAKNGADDEQATDTQASAPAPSPASAPAVVDPVKIGRWTEDEVAQRFADLEALRKGHSTIAGQVGDLRQRMVGQKPREITPADLPGVVEEFGESYAKALATDLNKLGLGGQQHVGPTQEQIDTIVANKTAEIEKRFEKKLTLTAHPDADEHFFTQQIDGSWRPNSSKADRFAAWVEQQPEGRRNEIADSWDSKVMVSALNDFKAHEKKAAAPAAPAAAPSRQNRLARAVTPKSSGTTSPPETDDFAGGYKSARGSPGR